MKDRQFGANVKLIQHAALLTPLKDDAVSHKVKV